MDFDDIIRLLFYIAIPIIISSNRRAKKAKQSSQNNRQPSQNNRQPSQNNRQPAQGKTAGGGLMNRLESMMKELEKAAETGKPPGGTKPATQTSKPVSSEGMHPAGETEQTAEGAREGYCDEHQHPAWQTAQTGRREAVVSRASSPYSGNELTGSDSGYGFFKEDDLVKGIILSEILQPPVSIRSRKRHSY